MSEQLLKRFAQIVDELGSKRASDIHVTSDRGAFVVKDKQTRRLGNFPLPADALLTALVESAPGGVAAFKQKGQAGASFDMGGDYRGRVAIRREQGGLSTTLRIISRDVPSTATLELPPRVVNLIGRPSGLLLFVGQTGSGKSTSIAAMVNLVNQHEETGIYTLESPIEYLYPEGRSLVIQREIGVHVGSFAEGIEDAKRSHPRIIVVGEILNTATARSALLAAASGHLVVSTMHAGTTAEAVDSFVSMFTPEEQGLIRTQLGQSLVGIIAQKLIPKQGGGMALAQEIALNTPTMAGLVRGSGDRSNDTKFIQQHLLSSRGEAEGMSAMEASLARLVAEGAISVDAALVHARDHGALKEKFTQMRIPIPSQLAA